MNHTARLYPGLMQSTFQGVALSKGLRCQGIPGSQMHLRLRRLYLADLAILLEHMVAAKHSQGVLASNAW
jgi:hypothetical protein